MQKIILFLLFQHISITYNRNICVFNTFPRLSKKKLDDNITYIRPV